MSIGPNPTNMYTRLTFYKPGCNLFFFSLFFHFFVCSKQVKHWRLLTRWVPLRRASGRRECSLEMSSLISASVILVLVIVILWTNKNRTNYVNCFYLRRDKEGENKANSEKLMFENEMLRWWYLYWGGLGLHATHLPEKSGPM